MLGNYYMQIEVQHSLSLSTPDIMCRAYYAIHYEYSCFDVHGHPSLMSIIIVSSKKPDHRSLTSWRFAISKLVRMCAIWFLHCIVNLGN